MITDWANCRGFGTFVYVSAVSALPFDWCAFFENCSLSYVF